MALIFSALSMGGCSGNSGEEPEMGAIKKMTDQVADELVHKMRDPIDKARLIKNQEEDRSNAAQNAVEESSRVD